MSLVTFYNITVPSGGSFLANQSLYHNDKQL